MAVLRIHEGDRFIETEVMEGITLLTALAAAGITINAPCGGAGVCGKCLVKAKGALSQADLSEKEMLGSALGEGRRLACRAVLWGDAEVEAVRSAHRIRVLKPVSRDADLVLSVDLGSTTLDLRLCRLDGEAVGEASALNPQRSYGADVISRIAAVQQDADALFRMRDAVRETIYRLTEELCATSGGDKERVLRAVVAGNTVMTHIFWGEDPVSLGHMPFTPRFLEARHADCRSLGWDFAPGAVVSTLPCISSFLGGDITAGLLACPANPGERQLLVDIGTNGETVLTLPSGNLGCAAAAGPALEGGRLSSGTGGVPGAINHVDATGDGYAIETIGGAEPSGLCGSGFVDAAALLLREGLLDYTGYFAAPEDIWRDSVSGEDGQRVWTLAPGVTVTQRDLRELQLAKGAIAAGIEILCREAGCPLEAIDRICLAGGLGTAMRPESACAIGLLPGVLLDRIVPAGNTSLAGAEILALHPERWEQAERLARSVRPINLAEAEDFQSAFATHMFFGEET